MPFVIRSKMTGSVLSRITAHDIHDAEEIMRIMYGSTPDLYVEDAE